VSKKEGTLVASTPLLVKVLAEVPRPVGARSTVVETPSITVA
jgi:hypothetical protein